MSGTYRTKSGRILTDADIEALSAEAEQGYDITETAGQLLSRMTELEAEVERLRAVLAVVRDEREVYRNAQISTERGYHAERVLADQLAEWLLRIVPDEDRDLNDSLAQWDDRRER